MRKTYTVESVTSGHPDKVCDQISDAVLDAYLIQEPYARVAVETLGAHGLVVVGGEVTSQADVYVPDLVRQLYKDIGYQDELKIITNIVRQSPDIAQGVDSGGAGDQGIMYAYATNETPEYMPQAIIWVHQLTSGLENLRKNDSECSWLKPDGKAQITIQDNKVKTILVSAQHSDLVTQHEIKSFLLKKLIVPIFGDVGGVEILVNPTGQFVLGGFAADTGLTGRKIMVDTYCGLVPHGGGCFSGKDPTKVDRSAAYMCRFVAKNIVANGLAKECLISVAYAIGKAEPLMVHVEVDGGKDLSDWVQKRFDFRPKAIIERLNLRRPIYKNTAVYGHFGKAGVPWEEIVAI